MRKNTERKVMNDVNIYSIPKVVVIGVKNKINNKIDLDESFNVDFVFSDFNNVKQVIDHNSVAILVDENEIKSDIDLYLEKLLKNYQYLPIFYLAREKKRANFFKKLYEKGLHGVINWPDEAPILQQLLVESLKPHPKAIGESKGDRRLSDLVKSHINLFGNYHGIKVKVIDGFAFLEGVVKSLYDKRKMGDEVESVLGIKSAIIDNLKIRKFKNVTDQELERRIKMFIGHILAEEKRSMTVKVRDRVVYIKGSSKRQSDLLDIQEFAMKQHGVMSVKTDVKFSPEVVEKNVTRAKRLEKRINDLFEGVKFISINILGDYAEVSGAVTIKKDKKLVEKYLVQSLPVKKVFNKLLVLSPS